MSGFARDLRYAARALRKNPGFALTAVLILGAGIGATTTIFSVVDTVLLRALPYPNAGRLVHFDEGSHSYPLFRGWRELDSFEAVAAVRDFEIDLVGEGPPQRLPAVGVSREFFEMLGAAPEIGRLFFDSEYPGEGTTVVLGHAAWKRIFGGDPAVVGRVVSLGGRPVEVVGVLAESFSPPDIETGSRVDFWFPLDDGRDIRDDHSYYVLSVLGRLRPDVFLDAAQAEADAQRDALAQEVPDQYVGRDGRTEYTPLVELREATVRSVSTTLWLLQGAVGMLLLIACANVANLFLARGTSRSREIALRSALGASRARIANQVLTESVLLAVAGGALGVALAYGGVELIAHSQPGDIPRMQSLAVDGRVLGFSLLVSVATGIVFGWLPALQATGADINDALKESASAVGAGRRGLRVRSLLVVTEIALAVVLLAGGGLLFRTLVEMIQVDPQFEVAGLTVLPLGLDAGYDAERRRQFASELKERLRAVPGTRSVATATAVPFSYTGSSRCCWRTTVVGDPTMHDHDERRYLSIVHPVSEGYFETLGASIVAGREFVSADMSNREVAILNARTARDLFGTDDVVGQTLGFRDSELEIVGVVEGVHHWGLDQPIEPAVYVAYGVHGTEFDRLDVAVRSDASFDVLAPALREAVWEIDHELPIPDIVTMEDRVSRSLATPRFLSGLLGGFALVALLLACGGVYGSMLYSVGQRRREMGIRLALGAAREDVLRLVLRHGALLAAMGILIGLVAGVSLSRFMESLLWGVTPTDPLTFLAVALALATSALLAAFVPAWKASRTDPVRTLGAE